MTDAGQLAAHLLWAAETQAAQDQVFNVVNGDVFRWRWMWGRIADWFGLEAAPFDGTVRPLQQQMVGSRITSGDELNRLNGEGGLAL